MISYKDVGVGPHSNYDTNSEVGVTSVITPLSIRRGAGGEASDGCKFCDICRLLAGVCGFPL